MLNMNDDEDLEENENKESYQSDIAVRLEKFQLVDDSRRNGSSIGEGI